MNKKIFIYLGFFLVLVLGFWYFLFSGTDAWKTKLNIISYVKPFTFKNQDGLDFTNKEMPTFLYQLLNYQHSVLIVVHYQYLGRMYEIQLKSLALF